ncbi:MAG: type III-B CRISPR module-associated protein Cmr3 [Verrucomicrobiae bacterium]|nr:type III-B CRISPR module-associated protein Cmr3 [Verrucomicrobiae bacterium]
MPEFLLEPLDILFFRDGRPMAAGQGTGHGCRLPLPSTLHEAVRFALLYNSGFRTGTGHRRQNFSGNTAFQSLRVRGPFLFDERDKQIRLPLPLDVVQADANNLKTLQLLRQDNHTFPPLLPVSPIAATKATPRGFWTPEQFSAYLKGESANFTPLQQSELLKAEHRVGVEIEDSTYTSKEGQLYAASYLRPHKHTRFWFEATVGDHHQPHEADELKKLSFILLGGDRRLVRVWNGDRAPKLEIQRPNFKETNNCLLKWVLLTPAIFAGGWLPGWLQSNGHKPDGKPEGEVRYQIGGRATLVSVCLGKPLPISGWDVQKNEPKPTHLAVPAGSVYYFECDSPQTAENLAMHLHLKTRSDLFGEKGYGLGVCGTWQPYSELTSKNVPDSANHRKTN